MAGEVFILETPHKLRRTQTQKKRFHHKSFSGCVQCKSRKIKCDETNPRCLRCQVSGLGCIYQPRKTRFFEITVGPIFESDLEKDRFTYFIDDGLFYMTASYGSHFQRFAMQFIPQLSISNTIIKQAVLAAGALFKQVVEDGHSSALKSRVRNMAISNQQKSMRAFIAGAQELPLEIQLSWVVVFIILSLILDRNGIPIKHINGGYTLVHDYLHNASRGTTPRNHIVDLYFLPLFEQMLDQNIAFVDDYYSPRTIPTPCRSGNLIIFTKFKTLTEMHNSFMSIWTSIMSNLRKCSDMAWHETRRELQTSLKQFLTAIPSERESMVAVLKESNRDIITDFDTVRIFAYERMARIILDVIHDADERLYDRYDSDFEYIVGLMESTTVWILDYPEFNHLFRLQLGIIPAIFFVATKCRNTAIRYRALRCFHLMPHAELFWTSCMAFRLAKFVIDLEISQSNAVCSNSRIRLDKAVFQRNPYVLDIEYSTMQTGIVMKKQMLLPYNPHPWTIKPEYNDSIPMTKKALRACGLVSSIICLPSMKCHCHPRETDGIATQDRSYSAWVIDT